MQESSSIIQNAIQFAKKKLQDFDAGHDWSHCERVWKNAKNIRASEKKGNLEIIELAAILHDIADTKFHIGKETDGGEMAYGFLVEQGFAEVNAKHVKQIINNLSFKKSLDKVSFDSKEFRIVQDADRLDAIGAIGIARAFTYGGFKNRSLYDPAIPPRTYESSEAYKNSDAPTLNHFYEKLFLLKDLMHTESAKKLAEERHVFMEEYLDRFLNEWKGLQ